ncbi:odorant receptor 4-like [Choristoneura fumiferana]|uniref:odorant receptor 4-like n=1 Tax=Choristoneura fumiferana TaxID=7141 RepID=UPI003D15E5B4
MATKVEEARGEINATLSLCLFCMRWIGLSFDPPANARAYMRQKLMFIVSVCAIVYHVFSEIVYIGLTVSNSPRVEDVVPLFHTFGYGALSIAKVFALWYKKDIFAEHLQELSGIWPMPPLDENAQRIKETSITALRLVHRWYFAMNMGGVLFYNVTPICVYFYELWIGQNAKVGFVWVSWYPFDKYQPINHIFVYIFEIFAGQTCVWIMLCTDLLFSGLASHIALLLRLLHSRLETLAETEKTNEEYYQEIIGNIKLHQRLIRYCNDLEEAFTIVNLVNVVLSSVNICCVVFVIVLLEPFVAVSNKLFLGAALIQIGMLCWYADDIFHSNAEVALAVYKSGWYRTDPRCRRALIFLIRRAQKPIAFTAMNFTNLSLVTYSSILTRSYSYFALLYTMYNNN